MRVSKTIKRVAMGLGAGCIAAVAATSASAGVVTATNGNSITIPASGTSGDANPFPSTIMISGESGVIVDVDVLLFGLTHQWADDLEIALVGPDGTAVYLWSDAGGGSTDSTLVNADITFDDEAAAPLPNGNPAGSFSGSYQVSVYGSPDSDVPALFGNDLSAFDGLGLNGIWSLYIHDDAGADFGSLSQGWGLRITTSEIPIPGAAFLFAGGLAGLARFARKKKKTV